MAPIDCAGSTSAEHHVALAVVSSGNEFHLTRNMLLVGSPNAINATLYDKLNFVFLRDIAPVASLARTPLVMEVHPSVPAKTLAEFIAYVKANPGKINYASAGMGTPTRFRRPAQDNDRRRDCAHPLLRLGAGAGRHAGRPGP